MCDKCHAKSKYGIYVPIDVIKIIKKSQEEIFTKKSYNELVMNNIVYKQFSALLKNYLIFKIEHKLRTERFFDMVLQF